LDKPKRRRRKADEDRSNLIFGAGLGGFVLFVVIVVALVSLRPYTNAGAAEQPQAQSDTPAAAPKTQTVAATSIAETPAPPAVPATTTPPDTSTPAPKPTPTPAPQPAKPTGNSIPDQMARIKSSSTQIIVITGAKIGSNSGTLAVYDYGSAGWTQVMSTHANFGKAGLVDGVTRKQGHLQTPTGIWSIGGFLFGQNSKPPSGTKMVYRKIDSNSWWSARNDSTYNTWVESSKAISGERLADSKVQYQYAFNSGYNASPNQCVYGRGTAIFIHCFEPPKNALGKYTHGCVAIDKKQMAKLFTILDPARNPSCAIGTLKRGTSTSIWAY
jgi:L,D-peptidoglycan transpeptidase YkuD (ErfK/YbiS/YcfS/YnhG family)